MAGTIVLEWMLGNDTWLQAGLKVAVLQCEKAENWLWPGPACIGCTQVALAQDSLEARSQ
jgi:hypothetical protein